MRRYLRQFLSDSRVIDIPAVARWLLLNFVILPFRPRKSARAYQAIWTKAGSPLRVHGDQLAARVQAVQGAAYDVRLAMRYQQPAPEPPGKPYTDDVIQALAAAKVKRLAVLCPAFVADCLETVEEIGIRAVEEFHAAGGEDLTLVPSLNSHPTWVATVAGLVHGTAADWAPPVPAALAER